MQESGHHHSMCSLVCDRTYPANIFIKAAPRPHMVYGAYHSSVGNTTYRIKEVDRFLLVHEEIACHSCLSFGIPVCLNTVATSCTFGDYSKSVWTAIHVSLFVYLPSVQTDEEFITVTHLCLSFCQLTICIPV
jgi:hypothetical protein